MDYDWISDRHLPPRKINIIQKCSRSSKIKDQRPKSNLTSQRAQPEEDVFAQLRVRYNQREDVRSDGVWTASDLQSDLWSLGSQNYIKSQEFKEFTKRIVGLWFYRELYPDKNEDDNFMVEIGIFVLSMGKGNIY